jgi:hypothetical protein
MAWVCQCPHLLYCCSLLQFVRRRVSRFSGEGRMPEAWNLRGSSGYGAGMMTSPLYTWDPALSTGNRPAMRIR